MKEILTIACAMILASCGSAEGDSAVLQNDSTTTVEATLDTSAVAPELTDTVAVDSIVQ